MRKRAVKIMTGKPPEPVDLSGNPWTLDRQLGSWHGNDLGPLHVDDYYSTFPFVWGSWRRDQDLSLMHELSLWNLFLMVGCLIQPCCRGEELGPAST